MTNASLQQWPSRISPFLTTSAVSLVVTLAVIVVGSGTYQVLTIIPSICRPLEQLDGPEGVVGEVGLPAVGFLLL